MSQHPVALPAYIQHPTQQLSCIAVGSMPFGNDPMFDVLHFTFEHEVPQPTIYETMSINNAFALATELYNNDASRYGTEGQPNE